MYELINERDGQPVYRTSNYHVAAIVQLFFRTHGVAVAIIENQ